MPARDSQVTQVGKRRLELSNLPKVLFPSNGIIKAQLIEYYFKLAPTLLAHLKGRPLSLVRFPEGVTGESFYQKNRPDWAPTWLEHVSLDTNDYVLATEAASLVWLANLAGIELHQMHSRAPHFDAPDYIVYDFDPPAGLPFPRVTALALAFRDHLANLGYHAFVKTTGRKGLHILTPIEPRWTFAEAFATAQKVAQPFVAAHDSSLTLHLKKEHRRGRMLLDIYRNRASQTIIAAYSVRGADGAPVSTPLAWEELATLDSSAAFTLATVPARLAARGDPWEAFAAHATTLQPRVSRRGNSTTSDRPAVAVLSPRPDANRPKHKTPEQLAAYAGKRRFERTTEPLPSPASPGGNAFVVHRHHASRLHYDLRLEQDGVLKSWAVPKGLPPRPGIRRLAVNVEDHPLAYVNFEGAIPAGEYGGGMMWRFAHGRYEVTKQKKGGFYFRLQSPELTAEYRTHRTADNQWLLERVDEPQVDWLREPIAPMLARPAEVPPDADDYGFEVKWDGVRALVTLDEGSLRIRGRAGTDLTHQFPELLFPDAFRATSAVFDGEIVCLRSDGTPDFQAILQRLQRKSSAAIDRARQQQPAVCYLFDCLYLDGRPIVNEPLLRRREWLRDVLKPSPVYRLSELMDDGPGLLAAVRARGLEGIVAKQRDSRYLPGQRTDAWLKIKARRTARCLILGYTRGRGDRVEEFGALHLGQPNDEGLTYLGKVGSGFDEQTLRDVAKALRKCKIIPRPIREKPMDDARTIWLESNLLCEVQYASRTRGGALREPVFLRLRPDLTT